MTDNEIKINLCNYDEDNPYNILDLFEDDDRPEPRNGCACDNCFYGRDKLAVQILKARRERDAERALADRLAKTLGTFCGAPSGTCYIARKEARNE